MLISVELFKGNFKMQVFYMDGSFCQVKQVQILRPQDSNFQIAMIRLEKAGNSVNSMRKREKTRTINILRTNYTISMKILTNTQSMVFTKLHRDYLNNASIYDTIPNDNSKP